MPKVIKVSELQNNYKAGVGAKAQKWYDHFTSTTGIADAARSDAAETRYAAKMQQVIGNKQRQKGLAGITDSDIKASVLAGGSSVYSTPAQAKSAKYVRKFTPYVETINSAVASLPAKTADPIANVDNRVKPIVTALHAKKTGGT